ncbi:PD-(D/E)XK nuclease family protein [Microbacterium sp. MC2]
MVSADRDVAPPGALLAFLANDFREVRTPARPVNIFELSGFPRWETVASRVLAYFLDPRDSRHGLGSIGIDTLLGLLDGLPTVGFLGRPSSPIDTAALRGSHEWKVETEAVTDDGNRIDILLANDDLDLAIAIENKIDAAISNPFESYARRAAASHANVLSIVLAPTRRSLPAIGSEWISGSLTYDEFFEPFVRAVGKAAGADERSMDLLVQFIENTSEKEQRVSARAEADMLDQFWAATAGQGDQLGEFFKALARVNKTLRRRAEALDTLIRSELDARGHLGHSWVVSGNDRAWGRSDGRVAVVYVGYELSGGNCVELMLGQYPGKDWTGFAIKAYPIRGKAEAMYSDFNHRPLGVGWRDPDADITAEFLHVLEDLQLRHPRGSS